MSGAIFLGFVLGIIGGLLYSRLKKRRRKFLAQSEYWIYLPTQEMPSQDDVMTSLFQQNPFQKATRPISPSEGILMSDIRLHVGLVLKAKNPHVFRPDLMTENSEVTSEILQSLAAAQSLVKVRYISEEKLPNDRHLVLLPHLAHTYARLGSGQVIYDFVSEELTDSRQFAEKAGLTSDPTQPDNNIKVQWQAISPEAGVVKTYGLKKRGLQEIKTEPCPNDHQTLMREIVSQCAAAVWNGQDIGEGLHVSAFDDQFKAVLSATDKAYQVIHVQRWQSS